MISLTYMNFKLGGVATLGIFPVSLLKLRSLSKPNSKENDYPCKYINWPVSADASTLLLLWQLQGIEEYYITSWCYISWMLTVNFAFIFKYLISALENKECSILTKFADYSFARYIQETPQKYHSFSKFWKSNINPVR